MSGIRARAVRRGDRTANAATPGASRDETARIRTHATSVVVEGRTILHPVTLDLTERRIAVVGANGSGKSTFARLLGGLVAPSAGSVSVAGIDVRDRAALRERVGFVFTNPDAQILMPTPREDIALSLKGRGLSRGDVSERVAETLARFGLTAVADQPAYTLSGGQKQLLALAAVLVRGPDVVIADEPTTLLDLRNARRMSDVLTSELNGQVVIVTHDLEIAERCDVAVEFRDGRVHAVGSPADVIAGYRTAAA